MGYVLGSRAGRQRYEQIKSQAQSIWTNPKVQAKKATQAQDYAKDKAPVVKEQGRRGRRERRRRDQGRRRRRQGQGQRLRQRDRHRHLPDLGLDRAELTLPDPSRRGAPTGAPRPSSVRARQRRGRPEIEVPDRVL